MELGRGERDLTRVTLAVALIALLTATSFWILQPFLPSAIWAVMVVVSTWPVMLWVEGWLWCKRSLAVLVMTLVLLLVFIVPLSIALSAMLENADGLIGKLQSLTPASPLPPPAWLETLPLVGPEATRLWQAIAAMGVEEISAKVTPYSGTVIRWLLARAGGAGLMFAQFLLTVIFAAIMYATGERWAAGVIGLARRLAGDSGESSVRLAGHAIRGVALGVVLTAILQSIAAGIGLAVCGVPYAVVLTVAMFVLAIAQIGPAPVLVPAVIWMYWTGDTTWATVLLLWSLVAGSFDNFLRPILIKRSADLPLLLVFLGVLGGLLAFGLIGIFVGPVVLAVAFTLLQAWIRSDPATVQQQPITRV